MSLVIVGDNDIVGVLAVPQEADPILVVHADAVPPGQPAFEGFKAVARGNAQFVERRCGFKLGEFAKGDFQDGGRQLGGTLSEPEGFGGLVGKGLDHGAAPRYACQACILSSRIIHAGRA